MIEVGSIMTVNLFIFDKPSVSKLCGYRLHSVSPSLDQLDDESATNQIGRPWFWGALFGVPSFTFPVWRGHRCLHAGGTCTCRDRGGCCVPWTRTNGDSTWWNEFSRKIHTRMCRHNHGLSYHTTLVQLGLFFLCTLIQLEKLSFLLVMMRFAKEVQYHQHWNIREERQRCFQKIECLNDSSPSSRKMFPPWYHIRVGTGLKYV